MTNKPDADAEENSFTLEQWSEIPPEQFDARAAVDAELMPLVDAVMAKALELGVPVAVAAVGGQDDKGAHMLFRQNLISAGRCPHGLLSLEAAITANWGMLFRIGEAGDKRVSNIGRKVH